MLNGHSHRLDIPPPSKGSTGRRHRMRCSKCRTRFTLKRHPQDYVRSVRCPVKSCRSLHVYSCEAARRRELRRQKTCRCNAYPFPHRQGSMPFCLKNPAWDQGWEPTPDDIENYERCIETPRSRCM